MKKYMAMAFLSFFLVGCTEVADQVASKIGVPVKPSSALKAGQALQKTFESFTPEQEYYLGRAVAATLLSTYKPLNDSRGNTYINLLGQALTWKSDKPLPFAGYHFLLLNSNEANAFAAPGGFILVTKGLVKAAASEDELAAALAHEIAHVQLRHGVNSIRSSRSGEAVKALAQVGMEAKGASIPAEVQVIIGLLGGSVDDIVKEMTVNGYSRSAELAADKESVKILERAGYSKAALGALLAHLENTSGGFGTTHPPASTRIKALGQLDVLPANSVRTARYRAALPYAGR